MKLPRNARIFQGQLDMAPFAGVFFLLLMFVLFSSSLVYTPGLRVHLPAVPNPLPGTTLPAVTLAIDGHGRIYFENQIVSEEKQEDRLLARLRQVRSQSSRPMALVIQADREAQHETVVRVANLARRAEIEEILIATRPVDLLSRTNSGATHEP